MANEFVARKGLIAKSDSIISGSLTVTAPITGSGAGLTNIPSSGLQAPGSDTQILFNSDGSLAADSGLVYSGSKLGIGITSPGWQLEVKGGIVTQDDNTTAQMLIRQVDEHVAEFVLSPSDDSPSNYFQFRPNSQGADAGLRVYDRYETDYVFLRHDGGNGYIGTKSSGQAGNLNIQTAGITAMTIQSGSNNVGIGNTNPLAPLDVNGNIYSSGNLLVDRIFSRGGSTDLYLDGRAGYGVNVRSGSTSIAYFDYDTANVGIGTTSPGNKLDVVGTIRSRTSAANPTFNLSDNVNSNWDIELEAATNSFKIDQNSGGFNSTALYITGSTGDVGIGTTSPSAKLHVSGTSDVLLIEGSGSTIFDVQGSQGQLFSVTDSLVGSLFSVNDISGLPIIEVFDTDKVVMGTFGQNTLVVSGSKVGIGTDAPARKFEIHENTTYLTIGEKAGYTPSNYGPILETNSGTMVLPTRTYWGNSNVWIDKNGTSARFNGDGGIRFSYYNSGTIEAMRITNTGNVGIGTTNPSQVLEVRDGNILVSGSNSKVAVGTATGVPRIYSNANEDLFLATANQSGSVVYLQDSNGYVGIGTSSPTKELTVAGAVSASTYFGDASNLTGVTTSDGLADILENDNSAGPYDLDMNTNNILGVTEIQADVFNGLSASLSYITASGDLFIDTNVGIGTTNPSEKLTVQDGSITSKDASGTNYAKLDRFSGLTLKGNGAGSRGVQTPNTDDLTLGTNNTERVRITSGGNVGIGTTSPSQKLEVRDGTLLISGSSGGEWIRLERSSGRTWAISRDDQTTNKDFSIEDVTAGTRPLLIAGLTGNIGIGNDKPSQKLTVQGNISASGDLYLGNNSTINFNTTTGTVGKIVGGSDLSFYSDNLIKFVESDDNIIRLVAGTNSGTFNINTTGEYNSAIKLYVNGDSRFNGDGTFTGDLTVSGIVTAQEFHTEFVSASIIYSSGSTKFGDSNDDIHQFTGSLEVNSTEPQILIKNPVSGTGNAVLKFEEGSGVTQNATITFNQGGQNNLTIATGYQSSNDENRIYLAPAGNIGLTVRGGTGTNDGNVGIGTTTPINRLQVITDNNAGKWRVGDYGGMYFANNSDTGHEVYLHGRSDGSLSIGRISGSNLTGGEGGYASTAYDNMYISSSGNVGIGTTTPTRELTVNGDIGVKNGGRLYLWDSHNNNYLQYDKWTTSASSGMTITNQASTGDLSLQTVSTTRLFISASGNVGIGTTSPSELLHVDGDTKVTNLGVNAGPQDYLSSLSARLVVGGNIVVNNNNPLIYLRSNSSGNDSDIRYQTALKFTNGSGTTHAYINSSGNVGIGTTSPSQKLEVRDGNLIVSSSTSEVVIGTASGKPRMQSNGNQDLLFSTPSYTNLVYLQESTGNVGIGTTSPNTKLTVEGAVSASGGFYGSGANLTGITTSDGLADILENDNSAGGFNLDMNDNDILGVDEIAVNIVNGISASLSYITASGDLFIDTGVGIGTQPNPTAALQVEGIISGSKIDLKRGGYITFYGDDDGTGDHAITSRDANGNPSDDLRINSFHNVYVNLDSNNNNTSTSTSFSISQHGGTGTLGSAVFSVRGDGLTTVTGDLSVTGNTYATASWATNLVNIPDLTTVLTAGNGGGGLSITEVNDITATGTVEAGSFIETSARRFKENIEPIEGALDIVSNIDGVTFNRIGEERREYGFIADEIESTAPELVSYDDTGQVHGVHYARTVAVLTEAVKELNDKVKAQDLFIKDLVARIEKLENN